MTQNTSRFNLDFDFDFNDFDPLEGTGAYEGGLSLSDETSGPGAEEQTDLGAEAAPAADDTRSSEERTADLLEKMAPRRKVLLGILSFCADSKPVAEVNTFVDGLQKNNYSAYTPADLCALLEKSGAIERVTEEGESFDSIDLEPNVVIVDGVEYLEPQEPPAAFWRTTAAGASTLAADKPLERIHALFDDDAPHLPIYERILRMCASEGGESTKALEEAVDGDPLVQSPRRYAAHFINLLEKGDAVEWKGVWQITEVGRLALAELEMPDSQFAEGEEGDESEQAAE